MPNVSTRCPECDAKVRLTVDEEGEHEVDCPKCGHSFSATAEDEERATRKPAKSGKATRRRDDEGDEDDRKPSKTRKASKRRRDDEEEDDRPKRYRPDASRSKTPIIIGVIGGALLLVGGIVALAVAFSGPSEKPVAKADPPTKTKPTPPPQTNTNPPKLDPNPDPAPMPVDPNPNPNQTPNPNPNPPDGSTDPPPMNVETSPPGLPAGLPAGMPGGPPVAVPVLLGPTEDVFAKAATFKPDGPLPELPPLPPVDRRPMLVLDPGGHTAFVKHVFFTPDASRVISVSEDKSVRIWDVASGEAVHTFRLPAGPDIEGLPYGAAMSPDGHWLAVGGFPLNSGKSGIPFYVLSVETGELVTMVSGAREVIRSLDFSPDGKKIAVGCANGVLQVYDFTSKTWVYERPAHTKPILGVRFHPKRAILASVSMDREVKIWSLANKANFVTVNLDKEGSNAIDWTSDGELLGVGCTNGEVRMYKASGELVKTVPPALENGKSPIQVARMKILPGDKQVVFGGVAAFGWAGIADIETGKHPVIIRDHTNTVMAVNRSADGALAVSAGGEQNEIIVWNTKDGTILRKIQSPSKALWAVGWGKNGKSLAWGMTNRHGADKLCPLEHTLRLEDFVPGPPPIQADYVRYVADDGRFSLKVNDFFTFTLFENGKPLYQHKCRADRMYSVTLIPGKGIVVGGSGAMYLLETKTGKLIRDYFGDTGLTTALAPSPDGRYFISGSTDQVIRVWAVDQKEPVLSLFTVGREWIAWTPQGYYACSPYGERLIAWQVNNGIANLPAVHPAVRFRASLYQPAIIKYLIPAGDMRTALAMASKFERHQIAATGLADVLPPNVTVTAPLKADDKPVTIRATAEGTAKNPIVAMRLLVDGRPFNGAAGVKRFNKLQKAEASWDVPLAPGSHTVAVLAESPVSKGMSRSVAITRAGASPLPNLYVLAVGVSAYPGQLKLNYAASDAVLFTQTIRDKGRGVFNTIEVNLLLDKDGTKQKFREGLDWLKSKMSSKDVGIVFFSGHGGRDEDTDKFYLITVDVGPDVEQTCLSGEELKSRLEDMPGRLVAILDACHSGAVTEIKPARADNLVRDLMTDDYGVVVLASSLGRECSLESPLTKAGFYTLGLTEGMMGRADFNRDGLVYLNELEYYAALRVQQLSQGQQNPTLGRPPNVKPFPIAKLSNRPSPPPPKR